MKQRARQRKQKGQAMIIIAGAIVGLIALVALAVDGGNAYAQRRLAQNAVDGAANAAISRLNQAWHDNYHSQTHTVAPMTIDQNHAVLAAIIGTLQADGADTTNINANPPGTFEAWYTDCDGNRYGGSQVGVGFQEIPFCGATSPNSPGARGVWLHTTHGDRTYFAQLVGVNHVSADAHAAAEIGTPEGAIFSPARNSKLWPITIMQDTINLDPNGITPLYDFSTGYGPGNWGVLDFTGTGGGATDTRRWFQYGFDMTQEQLQLQPIGTGRQLQNYSFYPIGWNGIDHSTTSVYQPVQTGNGGVSSAAGILNQAAQEQWHVFIPISTGEINIGGNYERYQVVNIAEFKVLTHTSPGSHNYISGQFLGYTWTGNDVKFSPNINKALINHLTAVRLSQ